MRLSGQESRMSKLKQMTSAAVYGTKGKAVHALERPLARRTPFSAETLRAVAGAVFLALSVRRIVRALRAGLR